VSGDLDEQLARLPPGAVPAAVDRERLRAWSARLAAGRAEAERLTGTVEPVRDGDVARLPAAGTAEHARLEDLGRRSLAAGELAVVVLAGGMATRMGGVVKALVEALPGRTFLDVRLEERARWQQAGARVPLWLMTSHATDGALRRALGARLDGDHLAAFAQDASLRLDERGDLLLGDDGLPQVHATGHGDLPDALRRSGLLDRFLAAGGRHLLVANVDNLGASVDPAVLGWHASHAGPLTLEVVEAHPDDVGGGPFRLDGRLVVVEDFRRPPAPRPPGPQVFSTNTLWIEARALAEGEDQSTYVPVRKRVGDRTAVQFERLLNELTLALPARLLLVPRTGAASRFVPVKDRAALAAGQDLIVAVVERATRTPA